LEVKFHKFLLDFLQKSVRHKQTYPESRSCIKSSGEGEKKIRGNTQFWQGEFTVNGLDEWSA